MFPDFPDTIPMHDNPLEACRLLLIELTQTILSALVAQHKGTRLVTMSKDFKPFLGAFILNFLGCPAGVPSFLSRKKDLSEETQRKR